MPSNWEKHGKAFLQSHQNDVPEMRYPTGLGKLDEILGGGVYEGQFVIVSACTGGAKSSFAECFALHASQTVPVLFAVLEMGEKRTRHRLAAKLHRTSLDEFTAALDSSDVKWRARAENALRSFDTRSLGLLHAKNDQEATVDYLFGEAIKCGAKILVIDHARELTGWLDGKFGPQDQAVIIKRIRDHAAKHRIATVLLQQIDKKHDGKRPNSGMIQDTSTISQKADVVLLFHLPYKKDANRNNVIECIIDKNRNGPEGLLHMHWTAKTMTMHDMTTQEMANAACCRRSKKYEDEDDVYDGR